MKMTQTEAKSLLQPAFKLASLFKGHSVLKMNTVIETTSDFILTLSYLSPTTQAQDFINLKTESNPLLISA